MTHKKISTFIKKNVQKGSCTLYIHKPNAQQVETGLVRHSNDRISLTSVENGLSGRNKYLYGIRSKYACNRWIWRLARRDYFCSLGSRNAKKILRHHFSISSHCYCLFEFVRRFRVMPELSLHNRKNECILLVSCICSLSVRLLDETFRIVYSKDRWMIINKSISFEWKHIKSIWRHSFCWQYYYISTVYTEWMDFNGMTKKALGKNMTCTINRFIDYKTKTKMWTWLSVRIICSSYLSKLGFF